MGCHEDALSIYNKAISLQPDWHQWPELQHLASWIWEERGAVLQKLGRFEEAQLSFAQALEIKEAN